MGCGGVGSLYDEGRKGLDPHAHAGGYNSHPATRLVAGADISAERRESFSRTWGVPTFADFSEMFERVHPDLVSICTWPDSHAEIALAAVEAGAKAVFCEKPLSDSLDDAHKMVEVCEAKGVPLATNHLRRWDVTHQQIRDFLKSGKLGNLQHATVHYTQGVANSGSHIADLLRFFFGEVNWVRAFDRLRESYADPALDAYVSMKNGLGCAMVGCKRGHYDVFDWDIVGTGGRLRIEDLGCSTRVWQIGEHPEFPNTKVLVETPSPFPPGLRGMMLAAVDNLVRCVSEGATLLDDGRDGLAALEVILALKKSVAAGERVELPLGKSSGAR